MVMDSVSDYIFNPVEFYARFIKKRHSWFFALSGLLLCINIHAIAFLIFTNKIINNLNQAITKVNNEYKLDILSSYGISVFGSVNIWIIWIMYIIFLICIDVIFRDGRDYIIFVKISLFSFYSMIPYLLFVFILALVYEPNDFPTPEEDDINYFINWIQEASRQISHQTIPTLIRNLEYFFDVWIIALITASYKVFSKQSYLFCCGCGTIYLVMVLGLGIII